MIEDSESRELIQIDHAARGMVSGTLAEWPHLKSALRKRGIFLPDSANAMELKRICAVWWEENMTSNVQSEPDRAALSREIGSTDGLGST